MCLQPTVNAIAISSSLAPAMDNSTKSTPIKLSLPLAYQQEIFREVYNDDTLVVLARGLGLQQIVANLLHSYDAAGRNLVVLVGAGDSDNSQLGEEKAAISKAPYARGLIVINTDVTNVQQHHLKFQSPSHTDHPHERLGADSGAGREKMYANGGVFTDVMMLPMLIPHRIPYQGLLDPTRITGLVILHAERVTTTSPEAFIVRMFRQKNKDGFLKAFSENPDAFATGFSPLSTIMRNLFLRKSSLWPRYHVRVAQSLEARKADVVELEVGMTPAMQTIQNAILQCIEVSISELRKANAGLDLDDWSVDSALHRSFDVLIRRQLDPNLRAEIYSIRNLLSLDAVSFHQHLETLLASYAPVDSFHTQMRSPWLDLDAADILFSTARKRVYTGKPPKSIAPSDLQASGLILEEQPKWSVLSNILDEIAQSSTNSSQSGLTLIMCQDRQTCLQVAEYLQISGNAYLDEGTVDLTSKHLPLNKFMHRKFLGFLAWRNDFTKFRASDLPKEKAIPASTRGVTSKKPPANKRRRVRGAAQFAAATSSREQVNSGQIEAPSEASRLLLDLSEGLYEQASTDQDISSIDFEMHEPSDAIVIHPYSSGSDNSLLDELQPENVIIYNPDAAFIRCIEVHRSSHTIANNIRVYFMYYGGSVEEQTYLSKVRREKDSFTKLIRQKANMTVTLTGDSHLVEDPQEQFLRTLNTRIAGGGRLAATAEPPRVSATLHKRTNATSSLTQVGDYILTPTICVERKSVKDLISSFKDGRLYSQAEAMLAGYQEPMLLIEFDQDRSFNLEPFMDLSTSASPNQSDLQSKLVLLTLHFPKLRIIWSSSPYQTAEIFEELKRGQEEPDPLKAVSVGLAEGENEYSTYAQAPMLHETDSKQFDNSKDILKSIPGINEKNHKHVVYEMDSVIELSNAGEGDVAKIIGPEAGRQVHTFLNTNIYST
ncbi:DNA repair protein rad16 [Drechslerella dactyloides]|uniref:DNA repair protein rad16 n=1 Tax=Drechslerella dactyloides TaxID=74499 RepID=A0AAD6NJZ7_DREDA|nr:DNA repair protein rad16 [Drechslerella dactyloides]